MLVIDPISALIKTGGHIAASHASVRMMDLAKSHGITTIITSLVADDPEREGTSTQISTIADTWIHLAYLVKGGERNRTISIVKSRGTRHSGQVRELLLSDSGISLADVYAAGGEVLVGTARWEREMEEADAERRRIVDIEKKRRELHLAEAEVAAQIATLQRELDARRSELESVETGERDRLTRRDASHAGMLQRRTADQDNHGLRTRNSSTQRSGGRTKARAS